MMISGDDEHLSSCFRQDLLTNKFVPYFVHYVSGVNVHAC